jgi:Holliday junction DNA helicase RuvA
MIGYIKGDCLSEVATTQKRVITILTSGGLGFDVQVLHRGLMRDALFVQSVVNNRDGVTHLYGFDTDAEKGLFGHLIAINGIGASVSMKLLELGPEKILSAAITGNTSKIKVPGVGAKTLAQVLLIKDRLIEFSKQRNIAVEAATDQEMLDPSLETEIRFLLEALYYGEDGINEAIAHLASSKAEGDVESLSREAISYLASV